MWKILIFFSVPILGDIAAAFQKLLQIYGGLDICINNAGISTPVLFYEDKTDGQDTWRKALNINLIALIDCTHLAVSIKFFFLV